VLITQAPESIQNSHDISSFECGHPLLNDWLKRRALANHSGGATRCYVVLQANIVVAYYALSAGAVAASQATGNVKRNMPDPIPILVLARLAIDQGYQAQGLGKALLKDAVQRAMRVAKEVGVRALLVHAIDASAAAFYIKHGFSASPMAPLTLMLRLAETE
jgi:GNAT superfamily N-acetyltransferase